MRASPRYLFALVAIAAALVAPSVRAEAPLKSDAAIAELARDLFAKGVKATHEERWEACRTAFSAALALRPHPQIAGNLAVCELKLGLHRDAAEHARAFLDARARGEGSSGASEARASGEAVLAEASRHIATLELHADLEGAEVLLDGRSVGRSPLPSPLFVEPGAHVVEARSAGAPTARVSFTASAGASQPLELRLQPVRVVEPPRAPVPPPKPRPIWPAIALGGGAISALVVGVGLTVAANTQGSDGDTRAAELGGSHSACSAQPVPSLCATLRSDRDREVSLRHGAAGGFVVAGVLGAGSAATLVWSLSGPRGTDRTLSLSPQLGPAGVGSVLKGTF